MAIQAVGNINEIVETITMESSSVSTSSPLTSAQRFVASDSNNLSQVTIDPTSALVFGSIMLSIVTASILAAMPKQIQPPFPTKLRCKVSCHKCRYFNANPYLKCALHPDTVLTEGAVDCRDYQSK
jgi:hypothetical protein